MLCLGKQRLEHFSLLSVEDSNFKKSVQQVRLSVPCLQALIHHMTFRLTNRHSSCGLHCSWVSMSVFECRGEKGIVQSSQMGLLKLPHHISFTLKRENKTAAVFCNAFMSLNEVSQSASVHRSHPEGWVLLLSWHQKIHGNVSVNQSRDGWPTASHNTLLCRGLQNGRRAHLPNLNNTVCRPANQASWLGDPNPFRKWVCCREEKSVNTRHVVCTWIKENSDANAFDWPLCTGEARYRL